MKRALLASIALAFAAQPRVPLLGVLGVIVAMLIGIGVIAAWAFGRPASAAAAA